MDHSPPTRPSLLLQIRDPQASHAWEQFTQIYTPLIHRYAMRRGLQDADAADVAQDVMRAIANAAPRFEYDRARGTFRSWLYTVARSKLNNHLSKHRKQEAGSGQTSVRQMLENQPDEDADDQIQWDIDYRRQMFDWAVRQVQKDFKETTWNAFWRSAVESQPAKEVAATLGISVGAVYVAKSRVVAKIRKRIQEVAGDEAMELAK